MDVAAVDQVLASDGVVLLRGALTADEVAKVEAVFDHGRAHPSPAAYTVSLRYFGDDASYAPLRRTATDPEGRQVATLASAFGASMEPGAPFRHEIFHQVRPR